MQVVGMLWRQTLGDESDGTKFRRPSRWMSSPQWEPSINDADMKHGPVSKLEKRNKIMSKETGDDIMSRNYDVIVIFPIYDQFGVFWKRESRRMVCKTYIFINSILLSYKSWKQNYKISNTALILLHWVNVLYSSKNTNFYIKKILTSAKLKGSWY